MIPVFESIIPIFLLVLLGNRLKAHFAFEPGLWRGLEQLGYYVLYPALLFLTIFRADFSGVALNGIVLALASAFLLVSATVLALWPALDAKRLVRRSQYSSVFQTAIRWNGFVALAVAERLFPAQGPGIVALVMAGLIIPINIASVAVCAAFGGSGFSIVGVLRKLATNPLILAVVAGLVARLIPPLQYPPVGETLHLLGRAALGMGLISIGAGLRVADTLHFNTPLVLPSVTKLLVFPGLVLCFALGLGVPGSQLQLLALCASVPTAMNGYLLARQMNGDAELYAAIVTVQTAASFLTIPAVLAVAGYLGG